MRPETKSHVANGLMIAGLLPYVAVLTYVLLTSRFTGDAALAAVFTIMLGLGVACVSALVIAFPRIVLVTLAGQICRA